MSVPPRFESPGVFVEETRTGSGPIVGVETSIAAFVGRARRGPLDQPVLIGSFADFESRFGSLWLDSALGYAVRDYFDNGGRRALVVRAWRDAPAASHAELALSGPDGDLVLRAATPGAWGNELQAAVTHIADPATRDEVAGRLGLTAAQASGLFDLQVEDTATGALETFAHLLVDGASDRFVGTVLAASELVTAAAVPASPPGVTTSPVGVTAHANDGAALTAAEVLGNAAAHTGMHALASADIFNLLCIPPYGAGDVEPAVLVAAAAFCERQRAILLIDPPASWTVADACDHRSLLGVPGANAAMYFPRLRKADPLNAGAVRAFPAGPSVAGVIARTDAARGVWKAPAGRDALLSGIDGLTIDLDDSDNEELNRAGVNSLRRFPRMGHVVWGARTLDGSDHVASEWKYLPVRRTALYIEQSVLRGTAWAVFEPNDEPLWATLRATVEQFMRDLFRQGAVQGSSAREAYFVRCDRTTISAADIAQGIVNISVGFAPLKPAEFIVLHIQQRSRP